MKVLLIDDDILVARNTQEILTLKGYEVRIGHSAEEFLALARAWDPAIVLLDVVMPGEMTGLDALRLFRKDSDVPVILVTGLKEDADKAIGLEYADDYLVKPFSHVELVARIGAVLRRAGKSNTPPREIHAGALCINQETHTVTYNGKVLSLTPIEYKFLSTLSAQPNRVFSREALTESVWGVDVYVDPHTLDVHIAALRRKLEPDAKQPRHLITLRGLGFRYIA
ncbi:MAG TPA: response regulator transcription factor [Armatimonadota bacterium]|nr:response regulator transcription factor [Armatimonadota bacterium]